MAILIVDDSSSIRTIIKNSLVKIGFFEKDIISAVDGIDALKKIENNNINVILTDWNMPNMNGYDFVVNVRKNKKHTNTPIVMITTEGSKSEVLSALKIGVNAYIVKPFSKEVLEEKIEKFIKLPDIEDILE